MRQHEFLAQLKSALENDLNEQIVKQNVDYYKDYIQSEVQKGVPEEEVLEHLGDPWMIAKTVILSEKMEGQDQNYESEVQGGGQESRGNSFQQVSAWKKILIIIAIVAVLLLLFSTVFGVIAIFVRLAIRFAVPILVVVFVAKMLSKK